MVGVVVKYNVILADPPWSYRDRCHSGKRGVGFKYPTMALAEISMMRPLIDNMAADTCWLFLWAPTTMTDEAFKVIKDWGFRRLRQRVFTWIKRTSRKNNLFWGMGTVTRSNPEDVWCGIRGNPVRASASVHSVIEASVREHSRKPDEIYRRIDQLCGPVPKIELFARQRWPGWDQLGDQCDYFAVEPKEKRV